MSGPTLGEGISAGIIREFPWSPEGEGFLLGTEGEFRVGETAFSVGGAIQARSDKRERGIGGDDGCRLVEFEHPKLGSSLLILSFDGVSEGGQGYLATDEMLKMGYQMVDKVSNNQEAFRGSLTEDPRDFVSGLSILLNDVARPTEGKAAGIICLITNEQITWSYAGDEVLKLAVKDDKGDVKFKILEKPQIYIEGKDTFTSGMTPTEIESAIAKQREKVIDAFALSSGDPNKARKKVAELDSVITNAFGDPKGQFEERTSVTRLSREEFEKYDKYEQVVLMVGSDGVQYCPKDVMERAVFKGAHGAVEIVEEAGDFDDKHVVLVDLTPWI